MCPEPCAWTAKGYAIGKDKASFDVVPGSDPDGCRRIRCYPEDVY